MKNLLIIYLLTLMVSANSGYIPVTIFDEKNGFDFCQINQPCKYFNNTNKNYVDTSKNNKVIAGISAVIIVPLITFLGLILTVKLIMKKIK